MSDKAIAISAGGLVMGGLLLFLAIEPSPTPPPAIVVQPAPPSAGVTATPEPAKPAAIASPTTAPPIKYSDDFNGDAAPASTELLQPTTSASESNAEGPLEEPAM